jgi:NADH-quinone oxidoreductase subunit C
MPASLESLQGAIGAALGARVQSQVADRGQLTLVVAPADMVSASTTLRDDPNLAFTILIDLAGMDYEGFAEGEAVDVVDTGSAGARFAVVYNLLSIKHNQRVRVKVFADSAEFPAVDSVIGVWPVANWFEREAFDLYGIVFKGHPDLRRILTDYGFVGHPFRKDFPVTGYVEMTYDEKQRRVIYQPVTIEPREIVPRVVREGGYTESGKK